jgi:Mg2+ and Co2+ transporter CorA
MFLNGYEDFLDSPSMRKQDSKDAQSPSRLGLLGDILFYWSIQSPECFDSSSPNLPSLAYFPLKIIAAEWMKYIGIMYRAIKQFEYSTSVSSTRDEIRKRLDKLIELDKLNSDMRALQRWRRRSMATEEKIAAVIQMLEAHNLGHPSNSYLALTIADYEHILAKVRKFGQHLETMLPVVTSLVRIIDSRRSFDETANVSRLTVMALIFVPLAYISSLFSMSERLGPGGPLFWVYFIVAIPVTIAVILIAKPPYRVIRLVMRRVWYR